MSVDFSKRQEWYDEFCEPDVQTALNYILMIESAQKASKTLVSEFAEACKKVNKALKPILPDSVPEKETVRNRALRLARQPHSMTGIKNFDKHGRQRY